MGYADSMYGLSVSTSRANFTLARLRTIGGRFYIQSAFRRASMRGNRAGACMVRRGAALNLPAGISTVVP